MRTWRKTLGIVAGGMIGLGGWISSADAQYPPPGNMPPMMGMPGGGMPMGPGMGMPGGGMPMGMSGGMSAMPPSMGPGAYPTQNGGGNGGGFTPGAFNTPSNAPPPDFPNQSAPTGEPASPFSIKEEGMPNAFTCLNDPRRRMPEPYVMTFNGQYLGWRITNAGSNVVLATTTTGTPSAINNGSLGQSNTAVLVPASSDLVNYGTLSGVRLTMGLAFGFLPPLEISGFWFNKNQTIFSGGSADASGPLIARPVTAINQAVAPGIGTQVAMLVNVPGFLNGTMSIVSRMSFWNIEANWLCSFCDTDTFNLSAIIGYRHTDLYESFEIKNNMGSNVAAPGLIFFNGVLGAPGMSVAIFDNFRTHNTFDGGQLGLRGVVNLFEKVNLFTDLKCALGNTHEVLDINGSTTLSTNVATAGTIVSKGGLLALPSNIGQYSLNRISFIPEADMTLSYQVHPNIRLFGGYNVLYWSSVMRPGDQISPVVDSRTVPASGAFVAGTTGIAPGHPVLTTHGLFANGYHIGIEIGF